MSTEVMKLATEFNRYFVSMNGVDVPERVSVSRDEWRSLFAALAQPQQEPVAWMQLDEVHLSLWEDGYHTIPLYTSPPTREIVCSTGLCHYRKPLTDGEIKQFASKHLDVGDGSYATHFVTGDVAFARAIEAAHGIKENT